MRSRRQISQLVSSMSPVSSSLLSRPPQRPRVVRGLARRSRERRTEPPQSSRRSGAGILPTIRSISNLLIAVTSSTICLPAAVSVIDVSRRLSRVTARRTNFFATSRSHNRVAVEACTARSSASCPTSRGPSRGQHDQGSILRQGHIGVDHGQRPSRDGYERPRRREERIGDGLELGWRGLACSRQHLHTTPKVLWPISNSPGPRHDSGVKCSLRFLSQGRPLGCGTPA